eukprot:4669496-Pleurochrysis_carterae.AAC.1
MNALHANPHWRNCMAKPRFARRSFGCRPSPYAGLSDAEQPRTYQEFLGLVQESTLMSTFLSARFA